MHKVPGHEQGSNTVLGIYKNAVPSRDGCFGVNGPGREQWDLLSRGALC